MSFDIHVRSTLAWHSPKIRITAYQDCNDPEPPEEIVFGSDGPIHKIK